MDRRTDSSACVAGIKIINATPLFKSATPRPLMIQGKELYERLPHTGRPLSHHDT